MGKSKGRRQQNQAQSRHANSDWTFKSLDEQQQQHVSHDHDHDHDHDNHENDDDGDEKPQASSSSSSSSSNFKWVSKNKGARVAKPGKGEVGGSSFGELGSGQVVDLGENDGKDKKFEVVEVREEKVEEVKQEEEDGRSGGADDDDGEYDDVVKRLEELQVGVDEVKLSEEQLQVNDQAQEDELLAMESIYGDNFSVLEKRKGLRSFQIHIHIELPGEYAVSANLETSTHVNSKLDVPNQFSYTFKVRYLSPIVLTCLLPRSYPSHSAPSFTISVQWLHESRISKLCSVLDSLWNEQPGQEVLYQWVEWLQSSALHNLNSDEELVLGPYGPKTDIDRRAVSGCVSPEVDIPSLKSYNEERQHENFLNGFQECCICFSEYPGTEFLRLPCHHFFCAICMKTYADMHINEGTVHKLQCPDTKCKGMIPPGLLKRLLGDEEFERWESMMLQKTLDAMSDVAYCPRCETACLEDEENHAQCSKCYFSFCTLCRERRHVGIQCMTPEMKLQLLEGRQNSSNLNDAQRRKEREMINELLSVTEILRDAKQCPSCKMAISKTEGCNKMVCDSCGTYFCYKCNKAIDGYEHFRGGCELFPEEAIAQWEQQLNDRQRMAQVQAQIFHETARPCPNCGQLNGKMGNNNHMFCWACQSHYCYLCKKIVRRCSQHYGPKGCKQHTAG